MKLNHVLISAKGPVNKYSGVSQSKEGVGHNVFSLPNEVGHAIFSLRKGWVIIF